MFQRHMHLLVHFRDHALDSGNALRRQAGGWVEQQVCGLCVIIQGPRLPPCEVDQRIEACDLRSACLVFLFIVFPLTCAPLMKVDLLLFV